MKKPILLFLAFISSILFYGQSIEGNPIDIKASPYITPQGASLEISGNVANTKTTQNIAIKVVSPENKITNYKIKTNENGKFLFTFKDTKLQGKYTVYGTPEDGKLTANAIFYVLNEAAIAADIKKTNSKITTTIERSIEVFLSKVKDLPKDEGLEERIAKIQDLKIKLSKTKADDEKIASKLKDLLKEWKTAPSAYVYIQKKH